MKLRLGTSASKKGSELVSGSPSRSLWASSVGILSPVLRCTGAYAGRFFLAFRMRGITSETAWLLAQALGTTPEFWTNLQSNYDLASNRPERSIPRIADRAVDHRGLSSA